jgi:hypothetical protein
MRASDLLGATVVAANHRVLGHVTGLRCTLDGLSDGALPAPRLQALVVTPRLTGSSLGYQQETHRGPWLVGAVMRRLQREGRVIDWDLVEEIARGQIRLKPLTTAAGT